MRIVVFGATGRTGRHVVEQLLVRGHEVVAYVRDAANSGLTGERLTLIAGGIGEADRIAEAVAGTDCVISAMGSGKMTLTILAQNLVPIMRRSGPRRIVSLCGAGMEMPGDAKTFGRRLFLTLMGIGGSVLVADMRRHWALLDGAGLDWTLVRPPRMTDGPLTGHIQHGTKLPLGLIHAVSRADLAAFMIDVALEGLYVREAPLVARA